MFSLILLMNPLNFQWLLTNVSYIHSVNFLKYLHTFIKSITGLTIAGDLNHDLLGLNGTNLVYLINNYNFYRFPCNKPTRIMKKSSTLLDVVYSNSEGLLYQTETIPCPF